MKRENFVFYRSFYEAIMCLNEAQQLEAFRALCAYGFDGDEQTELSPIARAIFAMAKPQLDANNKRYENGCKGGAPKGNSNAKKQPMVEQKAEQKTTKNNQKQPKVESKNNQKQPNDNDNDNDNDNVNDSSNYTSTTKQEINNNNYYSTTKQEKEKNIEKKEKEKTTETDKNEMAVAVVKSKTENSKADKEARAQKFYNRLLDYLDKYGAAMLREFYDYWTESNEGGALMRFEMERVFDVSRRLATWKRNETTKKGGRNYGTTYKTATERLRDEYADTLDSVLAKYRKQ